MAKDGIHYSTARKFGLGSLAVEKSIGITQLASAGAVATLSRRSAADDDELLAQRPTALMKWSFDDLIVEEVLPPGLTAEPLQGNSETRATGRPLQDTKLTVPARAANSLLVQVVAEGVPDGAVERVFRQRLPRGVSFHWLTATDFGSCAVRHMWVRGDGHELQRLFKGGVAASSADAEKSAAHPVGERVHPPGEATGAEVWIGPAYVIRVPPDAESFPLCYLPHLRYTVVLRNIPGSLQSVLAPLRSLRDHGFLNYGHVARHGLGALRAYQDARALLERQYAGFLQSYARSLTEGTPGTLRELPALLDAFGNGHCTARDWRNVLTGIEYGLRQDEEALPRWDQTGLYLPHHRLLADLTSRAADVAPRHHDSAQVIRESIPRRVLQEKLRVASEVLFNAQLSLRWSRARHGDTGTGVQVGDLVVARETRASGAALSATDRLRDVYEGVADHIHGDMTSNAHQDWVDLAQEELLAAQRECLASGAVRRVQTAAEADACSLDQLVLPLYGRGAEELCQGLESLPTHLAHRASPQLSPCATLYELARELRVEGLPMMRTAPLASFRHALCRPAQFRAYVFDEQRGWEWTEEDDVRGAGDGSPPAARRLSLKERMYKDQEGICRVRSPLMERNGRNMIARRGIRGFGGVSHGDQARHHFLKPARHGGMTCVIEMELPRGSPLTSALREVFQVTTLSPSAIFRLIAKR